MSRWRRCGSILRVGDTETQHGRLPRTEREKGVYDFAWLDEIVDSLVGLGLKPWITLCCGNRLYSEDAGKVFGAVGVPSIFTEGQRRAEAKAGSGAQGEDGGGARSGPCRAAHAGHPGGNPNP